MKSWLVPLSFKDTGDLVQLLFVLKQLAVTMKELTLFQFVFLVKQVPLPASIVQLSNGPSATKPPVINNPPAAKPAQNATPNEEKPNKKEGKKGKARKFNCPCSKLSIYALNP